VIDRSLCALSTSDPTRTPHRRDREDRLVNCACTSLVELNGAAADEYARQHLERLDLDPDTWSVRFRCPETGHLWVRDFPRGEPVTGGPPRLRRLDEGGAPIDEPGRDPSR
jgi:hypothetical protein